MQEQIEPYLAYSVREAARLLGVSRGTLYRMFAAGTLQPRKIRGRTIVSAEELRRCLKELPPGGWQ